MLHVRVRTCGCILAFALASTGAPSPALATAPPLHGPLPPGVVQAFQNGLFHLDPRPSGLTTQIGNGIWHVPIVLVSFADDTLRYTAHDFERMIFDTTRALPNGSVAEYWRTASIGHVQLSGRVVATVRLPQTEAYYANQISGLSPYETPRNDLGYVKDALNLCQATVPWAEFDLDYDGYVDMLWVVHAGVGGEGGDVNRLWSITSRMSLGWQSGSAYATSATYPGTTRPMLIDRFTVLPELSLFHAGALSEIGVFAHEFGHALGLPDLYDVTHPSDTGPGNWSLMSSGAYGGNGASPDVPVLPGAWPLHYMGWDHLVRPARDTTLTLGPLERSPDVVDFWFQGGQAPEHFLIENRQKIGYDRNLPDSGLVVYRVNDRVMAFGMANNRVNSIDDPGLLLLEADGHTDLTLGRNRGDAGDPFPGATGVTRIDDFTQPNTRPSDGSLSNIALENIAPDGEGMSMHVRVRPTGWQPEVDYTGTSYAPVSTRTPARAAGREPSGVADVVTSEVVNGRQQIVMRSSTAWNVPQVMSQSTGAALDPSLAFLPNGDLALVWSDSRRGRFEVYYRARIRGVWTAERPIVSRTGSCRGPSIAADGRGGLALAFQYQSGDTVQILFERFNYVVPIGQPVVASAGALRPENPLVVSGLDGHGDLLWSDRHTAGMIWFSTFYPDSGLQVAQPLSGWSAGHATYAATLDSSGTLHALWNVSGPGVNEIRYHRRGAGTPVEDVLESLPAPLESMTLEVDGQGSVHVAYSVSTGSDLLLRYKRHWPGDGWDTESTDLSFPAQTSGSQPRVLPLRDGNVDIAYTGRTATTRFMVRSRVLAPPPTLATRDGAPRLVPDVHVSPNPAPAGAALEMWAGAVPRASAGIDVFDAAGRRILTIPLRWEDARAFAFLDRGVTSRWPNGVYFARLRDSRAPARRFVVVR